MSKQNSIQRITICAVCIALCYILPVALHPFNLGTLLSPMHIPVLLCGLICGGGYGIVCGIAGPVLSSLLSGMPPAPMLVSMIPELAVYGLVAGVSARLIQTKSDLANVYLSLIIAMVLGRVVGGIAKALFYTGGGVFSLSVWVSTYFIGTLPGILCHLILIPLLVFTLSKAKVIPSRRSKGGVHG